MPSDDVHTRFRKDTNQYPKEVPKYRGSKRHSPDVYNLMNDLTRGYCIKEKTVESDRRLAENMAIGIFQAL
jgi:hypothetical protein